MARRMLGCAIVCIGIVTTASAHLVVDVRMSIVVPAFVPLGQPFTYHVVAEDVGYDPAFGVVVTTTIPSTVTVHTITAPGWNCSRSGLTFTCSAEQIPPGLSSIDIAVTAPNQVMPMTAQTKVQTLGSFDPKTSDDSATSITVAYEPSACQASAPLIALPLENATVSGATRLLWSPIPSAKRYTVYSTVEGAATTAIATAAAAEATIAPEPGQTEWWVEADFDACPPVVSDHAHFNLTTPLPSTIALYAGRVDVGQTFDGPLGGATFREPYGLAFDLDGKHLYVIDHADSVVRRVGSDGVVTITGTVGSAGSTDGQSAQFRNPRGITVTALDDYIYVADTENEEIRYLIPGGSFVPGFTAAGAPGSSGYVDDVSDKSRFRSPNAIAGTERGLLFIADTGNNVVREMTPIPISGVAGIFTMSTVAGSSAQLNAPAGIAVDPAASVIYVADTGNHVVKRIVNGNVSLFAGEAGVAGSNDGRGSAAHFRQPAALTLDDRGNLYVCDTGNQTIRRIAPSGLVTTVAAVSASGIVVDHNGGIYVADPGNHVIWLITPALSAPPPRHRAARH